MSKFKIGQTVKNVENGECNGCILRVHNINGEDVHCKAIKPIINGCRVDANCYLSINDSGFVVVSDNSSNTITSDIKISNSDYAIACQLMRKEIEKATTQKKCLNCGREMLPLLVGFACDCENPKW